MINILSDNQKKNLYETLYPFWTQIRSFRNVQNMQEENKRFSLSGEEIIEQQADYIGCLGISKGALYLKQTLRPLLLSPLKKNAIIGIKTELVANLTDMLF